jgi:hypothetical protein
VLDFRELKSPLEKKKTWGSRKPEEGRDQRRGLTAEPEEPILFTEQGLEVEDQDMRQLFRQ